MYAATDCASALSEVDDEGVDLEEEGVEVDVEEEEEDGWSRRRCSFSCSCRWRAWCCWRSSWRWLTLGAKAGMDPEEAGSEICSFSDGGGEEEEEEEVDEGGKGEDAEEEEEEEEDEEEEEAVAILRLLLLLSMGLLKGQDGVDVVGDASDNKEKDGEGDKGDKGDGRGRARIDKEVPLQQEEVLVLVELGEEDEDRSILMRDPLLIQVSLAVFVKDEWVGGEWVKGEEWG